MALAVRAWQEAWTSGEPPSLRYWSSPGLLVVEDLRALGTPLSYTLEEPLASIYLACSEKPRTASAARESAQLDLSDDEVEEALLELDSRGLVMRDRTLFSSLAVPATAGR